jgi:hypothetical protein
MLAFLFNDGRDLLGEFVGQDGAVIHMRLTPLGEENLGAHCERWQTNGIPVQREVPSEDKFVFYIEKVALRSTHAMEALWQWSRENGLFSLEMPDTCEALTGRLFRLPMAAQERFVFLLALRLTPPDLIPEWEGALEEATTLQGVPAVEGMKKKLAKHMTRPFSATAV